MSRRLLVVMPEDVLADAMGLPTREAKEDANEHTVASIKADCVGCTHSNGKGWPICSAAFRDDVSRWRYDIARRELIAMCPGYNYPADVEPDAPSGCTCGVPNARPPCGFCVGASECSNCGTFVIDVYEGGLCIECVR